MKEAVSADEAEGENANPNAEQPKKRGRPARTSIKKEAVSADEAEPEELADSPAVEEPPKKRGRPTRNSIKKEVVTVDEEETEAQATESRRRSVRV